ncbi:MAG: T9SS type A sorting domain-containing protein, partial [Bacteroidota bacterium]
VNWTRRTTNLSNTTFPAQTLNDIAMATATHGWAVGDGGLIYNTRDGGNTWTFQRSPYPTTNINAISYVQGLAYFTGTTGTTGRNSTPVISSVRVDERGIPQVFNLAQNYPNPFNPSTTIEYHLRTAGHVELKIFNLLGQEILALVNEVQAPGVYRATFNAEGLASGLYLYRLSTGMFTNIKKMVVVK